MYAYLYIAHRIVIQALNPQLITLGVLLLIHIIKYILLCCFSPCVDILVLMEVKILQHIKGHMHEI